MMFWFKSRKNELAIRALEKRVKILECDGHRYKLSGLFGVVNNAYAWIECIKCGQGRHVTTKEWREIELQQARDEVARIEREASVEQS